VLGLPAIWILRLSHRVGRDFRVTTHLGLVGRAFGAKGMYYSGDKDKEMEKSILRVNERWGGEFKVIYTRQPIKLVNGWREKGVLIHLTMYGLPIDDVISEIRGLNKDILVVVGGAKVPSIYYSLADYNIAITHQPHSEIAALAIFLDRFYKGEQLKFEFSDAKIRVVPCEKGKRLYKGP